MNTNTTEIAILLILAIALLVNFKTKYYPAASNGTSMLPTLPTTNFCIIQKTPPAKIKEGDIVAAEYKGERILHRIINLTDEYAYLKGDNCDEIEFVHIKDIQGKLIWHTKFSNFLAAMIATYIGLATLILARLRAYLKRKKGGLHLAYPL